MAPQTAQANSVRTGTLNSTANPSAAMPAQKAFCTSNHMLASFIRFDPVSRIAGISPRAIAMIITG